MKEQGHELFPLRPPWTSELLPSVQAVILAHLERANQPTVLEFGSGYSTIWLIRHGCRVTSFEHDPAWVEAVLAALSMAEMKRLDLWLTRPDDMAPQAGMLKGDSFDLVLVDGPDERRVACAREAMTKLKIGGLLVVDDSHWDILLPVAELLRGWPMTRLGGEHVRKTGEVLFHQTDIYTKLERSNGGLTDGRRK